MAVELIITQEAERDIAEAYAWYEEQRIGLGEEFLASVDACVLLVCRTPGIFKMVHRRCRRGSLRRFPYALYYKLTARKLKVLGVFHASRDPKRWRMRLL